MTMGKPMSTKRSRIDFATPEITMSLPTGLELTQGEIYSFPVDWPLERNTLMLLLMVTQTK